MAKGKQAALAAQRRYEAAIDHLDRMTTELADAKYRARVNENDASLVPILRQQIVGLQNRLEAACSVEVDRLREEIDKTQSDLKHAVEIIGMSWAQAEKDGATWHFLTDADAGWLHSLGAAVCHWLASEPGREVHRFASSTHMRGRKFMRNRDTPAKTFKRMTNSDLTRGSST